MSRNCFVHLVVYDYDSSLRHQRIKVKVRSEEDALRSVARLRALLAADRAGSRTSGYLERNCKIWGVITEVTGAFVHVIERLPEVA